MSDFPPNMPWQATPLFVSTIGPQAPTSAQAMLQAGSNPAAITWVANLCCFIPIVLPWAYPVRRAWWGTGSTLTSSNGDFGIYGWDGTKIYSTGSAALVSGPQYVTPSPTFWLPEGRYYFAWTCDNTTSRARGYTTTTTAILRQLGVLQQASVAPGSLPATMASAGAATQALFPECGITRTTTNF
jgi:hypothetical protein